MKNNILDLSVIYPAESIISINKKKDRIENIIRKKEDKKQQQKACKRKIQIIFQQLYFYAQ